VSLTTPDQIRQLQQKLYLKAKQEADYRFYLLDDKVYRADILSHAWQLVREHNGAPGVDGVSCANIEARGVAEWLAAIRKELHEQTYQPDPVRRVMIPKRGGGERPLGIPTVRDRVVQTAAKLVLEPILEADCEPTAYGYRPQRGAQDAVREVHRGLLSGYWEVVDADLSRYFDTIPHAELMQSLARRVVDGKLVGLIKLWLTAAVEERDELGRVHKSGGKRSRQGTPQGGVISPLLANLYMNRFLKHWRRQGKGQQFRARLINYADDFVILSAGRAAQALAWTTGVMARLKLTRNQAKTSIKDARRERFDFLGYTFGPERLRPPRSGWYLAAKPSTPSLAQLRASVAEVLCRSNRGPWAEIVTVLNRKLRGWANYFSYGTVWQSYWAADWYVCDRVRGFLQRRHQVRRAAPGVSRTSTSMVHSVYSVCGRCGRQLRELLGEFHRRAGCSKSARPVR
jgi:RNA-directed DNA polymerase